MAFIVASSQKLTLMSYRISTISILLMIVFGMVFNVLLLRNTVSSEIISAHGNYTMNLSVDDASTNDFLISLSKSSIDRLWEPLGLTFTTSRQVENISFHLAAVVMPPLCNDPRAPGSMEKNTMIPIAPFETLTSGGVQFYRTHSTISWDQLLFNWTFCAVTEIFIHIYQNRVLLPDGTVQNPGELIQDIQFLVTVPPRSGVRDVMIYSPAINGNGDNTIYIESIKSEILILSTFLDLFTTSRREKLSIEIVFYLPELLPETNQPCSAIQTIIVPYHYGPTPIYISWGQIIESCGQPEWETDGVENLRFTIEPLPSPGQPGIDLALPGESQYPINIKVQKLFTINNLHIRDTQSPAGGVYDSTIHGYPMGINLISQAYYKITTHIEISHIWCSIDLYDLYVGEGQNRYRISGSRFLARFDVSNAERYIKPGTTISLPVQFDTSSQVPIPFYPPVDFLIKGTMARYKIDYCAIHDSTSDKLIHYYPAQKDDDNDEPASQSLIINTNNRIFSHIIVNIEDIWSQKMSITLVYLDYRERPAPNDDFLPTYTGSIFISAKCIINSKEYRIDKLIMHSFFEADKITSFSINFDEIILHLGFDPVNRITHIYDLVATAYIKVANYFPSSPIEMVESISSQKSSWCGTGSTGPTCQQPTANGGCTLQFMALKQCSGNGIVEYNLQLGKCMNICTCNDGYTGQDCSQISECHDEYILANQCSKHGFIQERLNSGATTECGTQCTCDMGWYGPTCSSPGLCEDIYETLNKCSGHGRVIKDIQSGQCLSVCTCDEGYSGTMCEITDDCIYAMIDNGTLCSLPDHVWVYSIIPSKCSASCACIVDSNDDDNNNNNSIDMIQPLCNNMGYYEYKDGSCSNQCHCFEGWSGDHCQHDTRCQAEIESSQMCNGRGTIKYNNITQKCDIDCTCDDPTAWYGHACHQSVTCLDESKSLACGSYGYVTIIESSSSDDSNNENDNGNDSDDNNEQQPQCAKQCTCIGQWYGSSCAFCPIKCYNNSEYNNKSSCQSDLVLTPPCFCPGSLTGRYCQYFSVITAVTIPNRVIPSWFIAYLSKQSSSSSTTSSLQSRGDSIMKDLIRGFASILGYSDDDNLLLTNTGDYNVPLLYKQDIIPKIDIPLRTISIIETVCDATDLNNIITIPTHVKLYIHTNVGTSLSTLNRESRQLQQQWEYIKQNPIISPMINTIFDKHNIERFDYRTCYNNNNNDDDYIDIEINPELPPAPSIDEDTTNNGYKLYYISFYSLYNAYHYIVICIIMLISAA